MWKDKRIGVWLNDAIVRASDRAEERILASIPARDNRKTHDGYRQASAKLIGSGLSWSPDRAIAESVCADKWLEVLRAETPEQRREFFEHYMAAVMVVTSEQMNERLCEIAYRASALLFPEEDGGG